MEATTTTTTSSSPSVVFKLFFGSDDIRRISLNEVGTWEDFQQHLLNLYPDSFHPELSIRYKDEEGDFITITSHREWVHLLDVMKGQPIRLYISQGRNAGQYFKDGPPPQPMSAYVKVGEQEKAPVPEQDAESVRTLSLRLPKCLSRLFPGGKILPTNIPSWLEGCVELRSVPGEDPVVDLDVDVGRLFDELHEQAMSRIGVDKERTVLERARDFLQSMIELVPTHPIAQYNLACVESLLGEVKAASESLRLAIANGYNNMVHMLQDADLENLRRSPEWQSVVSLFQPNDASSDNEKVKEEGVEMVEITSACSEKEDVEKDGERDEGWVQLPVVPEQTKTNIVEDDLVIVEDPSKESKVEPEPEPEPQPQPPQFVGKWAEQLTNLAAMGFKDVGQNVILLDKYKGNMARVVDVLLR